MRLKKLWSRLALSSIWDTFFNNDDDKIISNRGKDILRKGVAGIKPRKETDNNIRDYILDGIKIEPLKNGGYEVFTPATQHFKIEDLSELTPETFEKVIAEEKILRRLESRMFEMMTQNFGD